MSNRSPRNVNIQANTGKWHLLETKAIKCTVPWEAGHKSRADGINKTRGKTYREFGIEILSRLLNYISNCTYMCIPSDVLKSVF